MMVATSSGDNESAELLFGQALLAYRWERRYAEAETLYTRSLAADPNFVPSRVWYAILLTKCGRLKEAFEQLQQSIEKDAMLTTKQLETARQQSSKDDAIPSLWGLFEFQQGHLFDAQQSLTAVLQHAPNNLAALVWLAQVLAAQQDYAGAKQFIARAREVSPNSTDVTDIAGAIERPESNSADTQVAKSGVTDDAIEQLEAKSVDAQVATSGDATNSIEQSEAATTKTELPQDEVQSDTRVQSIQPETATAKTGVSQDKDQPDTQVQPVQLEPGFVSEEASTVIESQPQNAPSDLQARASPSEELVSCPACGKSVHTNVKFCRHCGRRLLCPLCGERLRAQSRFCAKCGASLASH